MPQANFEGLRSPTFIVDCPGILKFSKIWKEYFNFEVHDEFMAYSTRSRRLYLGFDLGFTPLPHRRDINRSKQRSSFPMLEILEAIQGVSYSWEIYAVG